MSDSTAEAFEAALRETPDNLAGWSAYADYLTERGDPRGEFMQVQLALEDTTLDPARRRLLRKKEADLLDEYGRDFVGKTLAKILFGEERYGLSGMREAEFRRGVLVALRDVQLTPRVVDALGKARTLGWVRELDASTPRGPADLSPLTRAKFITDLKRLRLLEQFLWDNPHDRRLSPVLAGAVRLERLELIGDPHGLTRIACLPFPHLTELRLFDQRAEQVPIAELAANPTLTRLTRLAANLTPAGVREVARSPHLTGLVDLEVWAPASGDDICRELADTGLIRQLERLALPSSQVTDYGAERLLDAIQDNPHSLRSLECHTSGWLDDGWVRRFAAVGVQLVTSLPSRPPPTRPTDEDRFYDSDME